MKSQRPIRIAILKRLAESKGWRVTAVTVCKGKVNVHAVTKKGRHRMLREKVS